MKGGAAIANILKQEGVEYIFCFPNNPLIDSAASVGIRPIITRIERTAVNMAMGYARTNGGSPMAVCVFQGGPGIENAYGGVAQAFADSAPILILPGQAAQARQNQPSVYDSVRHYEGVTKWSGIINNADLVPDMFRRSLSALRTGRPRPCSWRSPATSSTARCPTRSSPTGRSSPAAPPATPRTFERWRLRCSRRICP